MAQGAHSEIAPIRSLLLKHPRQAWLNQKSVRAQWKALRYTEEPDYGQAVEEYERFVDVLRGFVVDVRFLPEDGRTGLDSIYVRDAALTTGAGLILCGMGKELRRGEPQAVGEFAKAAGWPVLGAIQSPGTVEGGDVVWLDERTLAVGHGYRTNAEGIRQLREMTADQVREVIEVPLPHWDGPGDVLHLMSMLSPVDDGKLLVYSRLLPVPFRKRLLETGFELLEVPEAEYPTMACNVLAMAPGKCVALAGNPRTQEVLAKAGIALRTYAGREISVKGAGGPTCLTRPLVRSTV
ncbi:MAG: dimethylarginine dimethylaminohydrolase family protein [Candidatus Aminicenantales bacterium]